MNLPNRSRIAPGAVSKKSKNGPDEKSVVVLKHSDVTIRNKDVYMPTTIEMAQLKKPERGQFRRVSINSSMTAEHIENLLKESFPCLEGQRFSCATAVDNRTKLDFHGRPCIWDGKFIRKTVKGNSALYIFVGESGHSQNLASRVSQPLALVGPHGQGVNQGSEDSGQPIRMGANATKVSSLESEKQAHPITSCMSGILSNQASLHLLRELQLSPQEENPLNSRPNTQNMTSYLCPNNGAQLMLPTDSCTSVKEQVCSDPSLYREIEDLGNHMPNFGSSSASEVDSGWQDDGDDLSCDPVSSSLDSISLPFVDQDFTMSDGNGNCHTEDGSLTTATDPNIISQDIWDLDISDLDPGDVDIIPNPLVDPNLNLVNTFDGQSPMEMQPESTVQQGQLGSDCNESCHTEDGSLTTVTATYTNISSQGVESIEPQKGSLEGDYIFLLTLSEALPTQVKSGKAEFCGVAIVNLEKLGDQTFKGKVPRCLSPGIVQVNVMTQNGYLLGITRFEYFDDTIEMLKKIVRSPAKQADFFRKWSEVYKSVSDSSLQTKQQNSLQGLQSLVYIAAQTGAWQFIELIFNTSAGQIVFDSYKDRTPLPEDVARAYGHDDVANYLQDFTTRFSKEPLEFSLKETPVIDWSELEAAATAAQTQGCLAEEKSSDDSSENNSDTDYFADVDTSSTHSPGYHTLSRSTSEDSISKRFSKVPPEILARSSSAVESYFKALADGRTSLKRVPIMLIGQDKAGKTSLKKSLKGIYFDPEEDSTVGIDVDPCHFKLTTETWRTGSAGDEQDPDAALSFDYHAARWIVDDLKESDESPLIQTSTSEIKTPSDNDETKLTRQYVISETEGNAKRDETPVEPATFLIEDAFNNSSSPVEHNPKAISDSTRCIPEEIAMETETLLKSNFEDNRENIYSRLWDFAGQSVYYVTHPLFLTPRAIYVLVYNLSVNPDHPAKPLMKQGVYQKNQDTFDLNTNLDYLDFWMRSVASLSNKCSHDHENTAKIPTGAGLLPHRLPSVFLVCTHADTPYDKEKDPRDLAYGILGRLREKPYSVHLFDVYVVDNGKSGTAFECSEVRRLRQQVLAAAEQLPYINEAIPIKWLKFERAITALKKQKKGNKCISLKDAEDFASSDCNVTEERESKKLLDYLHDLKSIVHFDDPTELNELVVLDPQWLIDVFKKVITVQPAYQCEEKKLLDEWNKLEECGLLDENLLRHMWKSLSDDEETYQSLIGIMEKFSLMCPLPLDASGNKSYLVPSMLKSRPPKEISDLAASSELPSLFLRFEDGHVPAGLFPRLVLAIFQWGKEEFWEPGKVHLFRNFARYFTSSDNDCSVIFVCHSSFIEIVVHNANIGLDSIEDLVPDVKMSYSPDFQRDNTNSNLILTRAVCSQVGLTLECMRHECYWLKNMRYEMSIICPVCCHRGGVNFCLAHCKQGCKEEECLHFWPISKLRTVKSATFCTRSASAKNPRVPVSQFTHWFPPVSHKVSQSGTGDSYKNFASSSEGNGDKALAFPRKLQESLASPSCDPQQIVSPFKEKQLRMEAAWMRCLSWVANIAKRLDVVQHLRSISPEGTVAGPLLSENLDVREILFEQGRQLTIALSGGNKWKLVAKKLGLNPREIRYLDNRIRNPAEAVLGFVAEIRGLTVGELYNVLSICGLPLVADEL